MAYPKLRVARATSDLQRISEMYSQGLGLVELSEFSDHAGFSGKMLGMPGCDYHLEFTQEIDGIASNSHSPESLLVFYFSEQEAELKRAAMRGAGFREVPSHNPYWDDWGYTFEDLEGYRVVICFREFR